MSPQSKIYLKEKIFHMIITVLLAVSAFFLREYYLLNKDIFNKLIELSSNQADSINTISDRQSADHSLILDHGLRIEKNEESNFQQDITLAKHSIILHTTNTF